MSTSSDFRVDGRAQAGDVYQHYKGGRYVVMCEATEEATLEPVVVYRNAAGRAWTRPVADFFATVVIEGVARPRFALVPTAGDQTCPGMPP